jgi:hypothetical protein
MVGLRTNRISMNPLSPEFERLSPDVRRVSDVGVEETCPVVGRVQAMRVDVDGDVDELTDTFPTVTARMLPK